MLNQNLKCADARHFIHLAVGDDTLPEEDQLLAEHLHACSDCRSYHAGMTDAMHAIERVRDEDAIDASAGSLWPAMADNLKLRQSVSVEPERRRFNGAVVALCACSLMLALVTAVQNLPANSVDPYANLSGMLAPSMNVNFQQGVNGGQRKLMQMPGPNGSLVLFDPITGKQFVPQHSVKPQPERIRFLPTDESLEF